MLRLDVDDAAVVAGRCHFRRRVVCDGCKAVHVRKLRIGPVGPQAGDEHGSGRIGLELQLDASLLLAGRKLAPLLGMQLDPFEKAVHYGDRMMSAELAAPEFLQIVASCIVETGELLVIEGWLAGWAAEITHRREPVLAVSLDDHPTIDHGEYTLIIERQFRAAQA